jgi:Raf kinase inhibitor-like YbhB/YbcL family protein
VRWRALVVLASLVACSRSTGGAIPSPSGRHFSLTSPAFSDQGVIPVRFTCDGEDLAPPLAWNGTPQGEWYVLVVSDPDAPGGVFVHWVVAVPPGTTELHEGRLPSGAIQGQNSFGHPRYDGPCPPRGGPAHHYVFTMLALKGSGTPDLSGFPDPSGDVAGRADGEGRLTGTYAR